MQILKLSFAFDWKHCCMDCWERNQKRSMFCWNETTNQFCSKQIWTICFV